MINLVFVQKWIDGRGGKLACSTFHAAKPLWRQFMNRFETSRTHLANNPDFAKQQLEQLGLNEHLFPCGDPYWSRVSDQTRKKVTSAMWPEPGPDLPLFGVRFEGKPPKKYWSDIGHLEGCVRKALSRLSGRDRQILEEYFEREFRRRYLDQ